MAEYTHNHYVPVWYQRRFMLPGQTRYFRLDLKPDIVTSGRHAYTRNALQEWSPKKIFAQVDLYTTKWGPITNTDIEQFFFGKLDTKAPAAVDYFASFAHPDADEEAFNTILPYMSVQKLRTPKGLADLSARSKSSHPNLTLLLLQEVQNLYCAIWTEAIWQIADASNSPTKFIISDHPVTAYNRACPPLSEWCMGYNDPDIRMHATHTFFPLSLDKLLIFTNLSWARNPYQNERRLRPNREMLRDAIFSFLDIQTGRILSEDEVLQINYITKRRAHRYIASADKEWLYPETRVSTDHWRNLGDGWLLMPEPRLLHMGGEVLVGYKDGSSDGWGPYGHKPWQQGFKDEQREKVESEMLERFKAEWAHKHGAKYTACDHNFGGRLTESSPDQMERYKALRKKLRKERKG
jgi:Protein of unknown function (DUF4238)